MIVPRGERSPRLYGFAWYHFMTDEAVYLPLGANLIAGWARGFYGRLKCGFHPKHEDRLRRAGYYQGFRDAMEAMEGK